MVKSVTRKAGGQVAAGHDDLQRIIGELEDAKTLEILALGPSVAEHEEAMIWAEGEGDVLGRAGRPLAGKAARIFDILTRDEEPTRAPGR